MVLLGETRQSTVIVYNLTYGGLVTTELAQLEERSAFNRVVVGSIPTLGAVFCRISLPQKILHFSFIGGRAKTYLLHEARQT